MKTFSYSRDFGNVSEQFTQACLASCQRFLAEIRRSRSVIFEKYRHRAPEALLQLALTEAEALAWQSGFPQLVFPVLAAEKAEGIAAWQTRQQAIQAVHRIQPHPFQRTLTPALNSQTL